MSRQANKTLIGGFVLGAVVLAVVAVVAFGSGRLFQRINKYVLFFQGSVKGLSVGAPVVFRGVEIGSVIDVELLADPNTLTVNIPVYVEIKPGKFRILGGSLGVSLINVKRGPAENLKLLIDKGLRAQLQSQSFVTGQLMVNLDFHPDKPAKFLGDGEIMEIPTIPSTMEELSSTLQKIPLEDISAKLSSAIAGIDRAVNSPEGLNQTLQDIQKLARNVDSKIGPLASGIGEAVKQAQKLLQTLNGKIGPLASDLDQTVKDTQKLVRGIDREIPPIASDLKSTVQATKATVVTAEKTLVEIKGLTGKDSQTVYKLNKALDELTAASRSVRTLADNLNRQPESLLRGKSAPKGR
jgi:paraquat-inducible protein B